MIRALLPPRPRLSTHIHCDSDTLLSLEISPLPNPDYAWKSLTLLNEWIRHYDIKAGVTLAFTGVLATTLINLIANTEEQSLPTKVAAGFSLALLAITAFLCVLVLNPRENNKNTGPAALNVLFYTTIARVYLNESQRYGETLCALTANPVELTKNIAAQVHTNAAIATMKAKYVKWSIVSAFITSAGVSVTAITIGFTTM